MYGSVSESMSQEVATYGRILVKLYASFLAAGLSHLCVFKSIIREGALWNYPLYSSTQKTALRRTDHEWRSCYSTVSYSSDFSRPPAKHRLSRGGRSILEEAQPDIK